MAEWSMAHAWKAIVASITKQHRNTPRPNRFNDFLPQNPSRCEPVNVDVCRRFRGHLTQVLHSSERHFFAYSGMFVGTYRDDRPGRSMRLGVKWKACLAPPES